METCGSLIPCLPQQAGLEGLLRGVLSRALELTWDEVGTVDKVGAINARFPAGRCQRWAVSVRGAWVRSLRKSFWESYRDPVEPGRFAVFGGTRGPDEPRANGGPTGVPSGVPEWRRWELLYDVSVVEIARTEAAFARNTRVPFVKRAIWLVESELAKDGTQVAEDLGKLRMGTSCHKLLIAAQTTQANSKPWIEFISRIATDMAGEFFVALMPTYASDQSESVRWWNRDAAIDLYRCPADGEGPPQPVGCPITGMRR
jgi:hypothetical protein